MRCSATSVRLLRDERRTLDCAFRAIPTLLLAWIFVFRTSLDVLLKIPAQHNVLCRHVIHPRLPLTPHSGCALFGRLDMI